jgi:murein DD-endopeptidase MepM/ murein hydrolase activator NlpD
VVQDFDGDGYEQTGWNLLYMHIYYADRVPVGKTLKTGDLIGHPSCEGGYSSATHLHFARKYNGVWIAADDPEVPFNLDGWTVVSARREYDGWLVKDDKWIEALYYSSSINSVILSP